ncbi:MAG: hypothetical protein HKN20_00635 [Gemmatimonadetes bacterium]|nr:hypothetical protein [Gemmatimonadota bacterium]
MSRKPNAAERVVAHRGYAAAYTENTPAAFEAAVQAGCRLVECDIQLTADHVPVLLHDESLARTFSRRQSIFELFSRDLSPAGSKSRTGASGREALAGPPTLAAFLAWLAAEPEAEAFLEIKQESIARFGLDVVAAAVLSELEKQPDSLTSRIVVISFQYDVLEPFHDAGFAIGCVLREKTRDSMAAARALAPEWLFYDILKPGADALEAGPWKWCLYEITSAGAVAGFRDRHDVYFETMQVEKVRGELTAWDGHA